MRNDKHGRNGRTGGSGSDEVDDSHSEMNRRDFLGLGVVAGGAIAAGRFIRLPGVEAHQVDVKGYFGTFKNLNHDRYGWPSLEHDPSNDALWAAQEATAAVDHTGLHFSNVDANNDQSVQVQNAIDYIGDGYDGIYINTGTPAGWANVIKQVKAATCRTMNHSPDVFTGATQNVVVDHADAGYINAQAAAKWIAANAPGKGAAVCLAILDSVPLKLRTDAFKAELARLVPGVKIYTDVSVPLNDASASAAAAEAVTTSHPDINVMFNYNDESGIIVAEALEKAGINDPKKFWMGGVDGTTLPLQAIASGKSIFQATAAFLFNYSGAYLMKDLETSLSGGKIYPTGPAARTSCESQRK